MAITTGKLTALRISRLSEPGMYADGGGLYLQIKSAAAKSWIFRYRLAGKSRAIGDMAARTRTAVLCNNHFSKGGGTANNKMIGSVAFINYCRAGFIVTPDAGDESRLLLMPSKMNIAPIKQDWVALQTSQTPKIA